MITIQAIDHVVLRVIDLDSVARFYIDVLGARWEKKQEAVGLYQLRVGTALIDLVPVDGKLGRMGGAAPGAEGRNVDQIGRASCRKECVSTCRSRWSPEH